jgi:hypothetical protein
MSTPTGVQVFAVQSKLEERVFLSANLDFSLLGGNPINTGEKNTFSTHRRLEIQVKCVNLNADPTNLFVEQMDSARWD